MNFKKTLSALFLSGAMAFNAGAVNLYVDSVKLEPEVPPTVVDGHTLVPLRSIFDALGASLEWDNNTSTATGVRGDSMIEIQIGSPTANVNGEIRALETPAQVIDGNTMVPARFVTEGLNCIVKWDKATDGIYISTTGVDPVIPSPTPAIAPTPAPVPDTTSPSISTSSTPIEKNEYQGDTVYVTKTGKRYHYSSTCNGGTYYESTLTKAKQRGLTPCQKCAK